MNQEIYNSFKAFLNDISRDERVTGHDKGRIIDTMTRQVLGHWEMQGTTVQVRWA